MEKISPEDGKLRITLNRKVDPNNYDNVIEGTHEENLFCAFLVIIADPQVYLTGAQFPAVYWLMVSMVFGGIVTDSKQYPHLEDTRIFEDIHSLKGVKVDLLNRLAFLRIINFLSNGNQQFCQEAMAEFRLFKTRMLVFSLLSG